MNGLMPPFVAFRAAKDLHVEHKFNIHVRLHHAQPPCQYRGDQERKKGNTATVGIQLTDASPSLDQLNWALARINELGWNAEWDGNCEFDIMGERPRE